MSNLSPEQMTAHSGRVYPREHDAMCGEGGYVDQALAALGGDDAGFMVTAEIRGLLDADDLGHQRPMLVLSCRADGCKWGEMIGQMELWELVADAREHYEKQHRAT